MVETICRKLSFENFVYFGYFITILLQFSLILSLCAKKKKNSKGKNKKILEKSCRTTCPSVSSNLKKKSIGLKKKDPIPENAPEADSVASKKRAAKGPSPAADPVPENKDNDEFMITVTTQKAGGVGVSGAAAGGGAAEQPNETWNPPPEHEKPRNPGFLAPIEATEETKTQYQINGFRDAADFT